MDFSLYHTENWLLKILEAMGLSRNKLSFYELDRLSKGIVLINDDSKFVAKYYTVLWLLVQKNIPK